MLGAESSAWRGPGCVLARQVRSGLNPYSGGQPTRGALTTLALAVSRPTGVHLVSASSRLLIPFVLMAGPWAFVLIPGGSQPRSPVREWSRAGLFGVQRVGSPQLAHRRAKRAAFATSARTQALERFGRPGDVATLAPSGRALTLTGRRGGGSGSRPLHAGRASRFRPGGRISSRCCGAPCQNGSRPARAERQRCEPAKTRPTSPRWRARAAPAAPRAGHL